MSSTAPTAEAAIDTDRLDEVVDRAGTAARAFRALDQETVDRIVWDVRRSPIPACAPTRASR
jgi:hypothetical protein